MADTCQWTQEDYDGDRWVSDCGNDFCLFEGGPVENGMKFCCYCGKPLTEEFAEDPYAEGSDE